jgi:hypothetical protein
MSGKLFGQLNPGTAYMRTCSMRFVFLDPGFEAGEEDSFAVEFLLWQEIAHQRF